MGLWGKDGFEGERERWVCEGKRVLREKDTGKEGFLREKDTGGGHGRGKQELQRWRRREREMGFWLCVVKVRFLF